MEQRYHVNIEIQDGELKEKKFTIILTSNDDLKGILAMVCDFNGVAYYFNATNETYMISAAH